MKKKTPISEVMTDFPYSIPLHSTVEAARAMMRELDIRHLPVQDGSKLVGIMSDRDAKFASGWETGSKKDLKVADVYRPNPYVVEPSTPLDEVVLRLAEAGIGSALVVQKGKLLGIFTTVDACRLFAHHLRDECA